MGVERTYYKAFLKRDPIPLPWIVMPRDIPSLSGIILTIEAIPASDDEAGRKFWDSLREHCVGVCRRFTHGEAV